jgi:hypothetical protein
MIFPELFRIAEDLWDLYLAQRLKLKAEHILGKLNVEDESLDFQDFQQNVRSIPS